jgi:hypothetical protein
MNHLILNIHLKLLFLSAFFVFSVQVLAQVTYTVVCDKTEHQLKIVESTDRSPNYVPIKGGFPFRQVAQKWLDENYTTTACDPGQIIREVQAPAISPQNQANVQTPPAQPTQPSFFPPGSTAGNVSGTSRSEFKNTSMLFQIKFANLGGAFMLAKNMTPGMELGIEQLFGQKIYFGTGLAVNLYLTDFESKYGFDEQTFFMARMPFFAGFRTQKNSITVMYEAGVHINTKLASTDSEFEIPGKTPLDNSFNLMGRIKIGKNKLLLEIGSEMWLTGFFEEDDFTMNSTFVGIRYFF